MSFINSIYLVSNIFHTIVLYKFARSLLGETVGKRKWEYSSYAAFFAVTSLVFFFRQSPLYSVAANIFALILISLNYKTTIKIKVLSVIFIYAISVLAEVLVANVLRLLGFADLFSYNANLFTIGRMSSEIVLFLCVLLFSNFRLRKTDTEIPLLYWIAIVVVPLMTLFPAIFIAHNTSNDLRVMLFTTISLFTLNILVFFLYDGLMKSHTALLEKELLSLQNKAYTKELEIYKKSIESISVFKHDYRSHISSINILAEKQDYEELKKYIKDMNSSVLTSAEYVNTDNYVVDGVLNYKFYEAETQEINIDFNVSIPKELGILPFDLAAILTNLLDNAIEAVSKLESGRNIKFSLVYDRGIVYIKIENPYIGDLIEKNGHFATTKKWKENHGLGLVSISSIVDKYSGTMNIDRNNGRFCVSIMLYNLDAEIYLVN